MKASDVALLLAVGIGTWALAKASEPYIERQGRRIGEWIGKQERFADWLIEKHPHVTDWIIRRYEKRHRKDVDGSF